MERGDLKYTIPNRHKDEIAGPLVAVFGGSDERDAANGETKPHDHHERRGSKWRDAAPSSGQRCRSTIAGALCVSVTQTYQEHTCEGQRAGHSGPVRDDEHYSEDGSAERDGGEQYNER